MKNKSVGQTCLAIIMLMGIAICPAGAQESPGTAAKPAPTPTAPPAGPAKSAAPAPTESPDTVVLKVGAAQVTKGDLDFLISNLNPQGRQALALHGRRPFADWYVNSLVLSQAAESDHLESVPEVRQRIELQRQQLLASAEMEKLRKEVQPSPEEITQYFMAHQPDFERVQMRQFLVRKRPEGSKATSAGLTAEEARAKADAIRKAVTDGTDLKKVSEQFGVPNVVLIDMDPRPIRRHSLPPAMDEVAFSLKDGEVSPPIDMPQAIVLIQVSGHVHPEQKEVAAEIESTLHQQKLEAKLEDLKKKTGVWMDEQYFNAPPAKPPVPAAPPAGPAQGTPGPRPPGTVQAPKQ